MTRAEAQRLLDLLPGEHRILTAQEHRRRTGELHGASASWRGIARWDATLSAALERVVRAAYTAHGVALPEAR